MTTGSNNKREQKASPKKGFWGKATNPRPEYEQGLEHKDATQEPEHDELASSEPRQKGAQSGVTPPWMHWREDVFQSARSDVAAVDDEEPLGLDDSQTQTIDVEDTAALPRLGRSRRNEVVEPPVVEPPIVEQPVVERPVVEQPVVEQPAVEPPVVEQPEDSPAEMRDLNESLPALEWDDVDSAESEDAEDVGSAGVMPLRGDMDFAEEESDVDSQGGSFEEVPTTFEATATYDSRQLNERLKPKKKMGVRNALIALVVVLALVGVYAFGVWYFSSHFLPRTSINGFSASGMTVGAAKDGLEQETADYACVVNVNDFSATIHGADIGADRDEQSMVEEAMRAQSPFAWPIALLFPPAPNVDAHMQFEEEALKNIVCDAADAYNDKLLPTSKASIELDEETGLYQIEGTTSGTMVDGERVAQAVTSDVRDFKRESNPSADVCTREATAQDIPRYAKAVRNVNLVRSTDIPILMDGEEATYAYASNNASLVSIDEDASVVVNEDALTTWAEYDVASAVWHADDWSYYMLDTEKFVEEFADRLKNGNVDGYEAPFVDELKTEGVSRELAYQHGGWEKEMGRYIDIDLDAQFARLFDEDGTVIWESAFVSGDTYEGHSTVTGVFSIYSMQTNAVLVGMDYNGDGEPDYESFVNYWMPFYGGYGLHDATWRAHFGGDYFAYDGSHGCVNLPYSKASELYSITFVGEQVYVHW